MPPGIWEACHAPKPRTSGKGRPVQVGPKHEEEPPARPPRSRKGWRPNLADNATGLGSASAPATSAPNSTAHRTLVFDDI